MARLAGFLLLLVLIVFGITFAVLNAEPVTLNYYLGMIDLPLSMIAVLCLVGGVIIGLLVNLFTILRLKQQAGSLKRQLRAAEKEADRVSLLPANE